MTLARFTPSILDGDTLEQLFVHRHHLLDDVMAAVREAAAGDGRRHRLFVGPRGAGKTHLISLVNHRVRRARASGLRVGLSWLMEDPWEIETYNDLVEQVLEEAGADPSGGEQGLLDLVADQGPIVVLIENLDQIFEQIGADGQRQLRALLENHRPLLIIATSTRLSDDISSQPVPFYGFFDVIQLEPFSVDQAADMLRQVAEYAEDESLASLLATPQATARLATISHLAGGQPRVWALLGAGLTNTGVDDMIEMLLARFDDLTPYYQEQLARLSTSERKAVRRLADADRPLTVRDLARLARSDDRSMSKTVSDLRKRGWIRRYQSALTDNLDSRLSYYELAEPLARIAFQMKAARGAPVHLIVEFLSIWFGDELLRAERKTSTSSPYRAAALEGASYLRALVAAMTHRDSLKYGPAVPLEMLKDVEHALAYLDRTGNAAKILALPGSISQLLAERLAALSPLELRLLVAESAVIHQAGSDWQEVLDDLASAAQDDAQRARAVAALIVLNSDSAIACEALANRLDGLLNDSPEPFVTQVYTWLSLGLVIRHVPPEVCLQLANRTLLSRPEYMFSQISVRYVAALDLAERGEAQLATRIARDDLDRVEGMSTLFPAVVYMLATVLIRLGRGDEALVVLDLTSHESASFQDLRAQAASTAKRDRQPS